MRIAMFAAVAGLLVVGLCVPEAFGDRALPFAIAYALVRAGQIVLFLIAARDDANLRRSIIGLAVSSALGVGLLVGAAFVDGGAQYALWIVAILVDFGGPAFFGADGWTLVPAHFAERHGLIIILALGESIVALGVGAELDADRRGVRRGGARRRDRGRALVDLLRRRCARHRAAAVARRARTTAQRARARLVLVPALPDGRGDRARRVRSRGGAPAPRRPAGARPRVRLVRRRGALPPRPRRAPLAQRAHAQPHPLRSGRRCCSCSGRSAST